MTFANDLARFIEKTGKNADTVVRTVTLEMGNSLIEMSPVDTGRFRANWQHNSARPHTGTTETVDPSGQGSKSQLAASLQPVKAGGIEFVSNNLPYARELESGSSQQAPAGMVRVTATRFRQLLRDEVKKLP
jgi:hypothetical protein